MARTSKKAGTTTPVAIPAPTAAVHPAQAATPAQKAALTRAANKAAKLTEASASKRSSTGSRMSTERAQVPSKPVGRTPGKPAPRAANDQSVQADKVVTRKRKEPVEHTPAVSNSKAGTKKLKTTKVKEHPPRLVILDSDDEEMPVSVGNKDPQVDTTIAEIDEDLEDEGQVTDEREAETEEDEDVEDPESFDDDLEELEALARNQPAKLKEKMQYERPIWAGTDHETDAPSSLNGPTLKPTKKGVVNKGITSESKNTEGPLAAGAIFFPSTGANASPAPSPPSWPSSTELVLPPPGRKLCLSAQNPFVRKTITDSLNYLFASLVFNNAYPDPGQRTQFIRGALITAAGARPGCSDIRHRLLQDAEYVNMICPISSARISLFRGDIKDSCAKAIFGMYHLTLGPLCKDTVLKLLLDYRYIFPQGPTGKGMTRRNKPYRHPIIVSVIQQHFFDGPSSFASRNEASFPFTRDDEGNTVREVPAAMVSLVSTAVYASLYECRTGERKPVDFAANVYADVYSGHMSTLKQIEEQRESSYHIMMADIYSQAQRAASNVKDSSTSVVAPAQVDFDHMDDDSDGGDEDIA